MSCRDPRVWMLVVGWLLAFGESVAFAQSHDRADVVVGYVRSWGTAFDRWPAIFNEEDSPKQPVGWTVSATLHVSPLIGLTGEVAGTYLPVPEYGGPRSSLLLEHHSILAGPTIRL